VRGVRSTSGLAEYADDLPDRDAVAVARLRAAGAVIVGKTNVPPGITGQETANSLFGRTVNPWNEERTPGGSSGGAAAALAAGLTALDVGSDSGGSVRQPAHCCGVFGHVPTHGLVPLRGHRPQVPFEHPGKDVDLMTAGPLARSPVDLAVALDVLTGDDPGVGGGLAFPLPPPAVHGLRGARVGVWLDDPACPTDHEVLEVLEQLADRIAAAGARVRRCRPGFELEEAWQVAFPLWLSAASARTSDEEVQRLLGERDAPGLAGLRASAETMSHRDWLRLDERRHELQREWLRLLADCDVVLLPVIPVVAPPHDDAADLDAVASVDRRLARTVRVNGRDSPYLAQLTWNIVVGMAGLPATVVPAGLSASGLPVGAQVVGARYADRTTLAFARLLEVAGIARFVPPPDCRGEPAQRG
jgi:amidase